MGGGRPKSKEEEERPEGEKRGEERLEEEQGQEILKLLLVLAQRVLTKERTIQ